MKIKSAFILGFVLLISMFGFGQKQMDISRLFAKSESISTRAQDFAYDMIPLTLDASYLQKVYKEKNYDISINIPLSTTDEVVLELNQFNILSKSFVLRTSSGDTINDYQAGLFYRGSIKGREGFATLSIFGDRVWGIISLKGIGNFNIVKLKDAYDKYVVYNDQKKKHPQSFECHTSDEEDLGVKDRHVDVVELRTDDCIKFYIEGDYELYQEEGGTTGATDWINAVFAEMATLYDNENISVEISEIMVWDSPDGYDQNDSGIALDQFEDNNPTFNGDLASLYALGGNGTGGLAYVDVLCGWHPYAYMNVHSYYASVPDYSWTVEVVTHEVGHNIGSKHTHACVWNGNNTQIDDCGNKYYYDNGDTPEGEACFDPNNPILPAAGTIMSYCHLISGIGIDFNLGFGDQPGDKIRNRYNNASCLTPCTGGSATPIADFEGDPIEICEGDDVFFTDLSSNSPDTWEWTFDGGTPYNAYVENPVVTYNTAGYYNVELEVSNSAGSDVKLKEDYITVFNLAQPSFTYEKVTDTEVHFTNTSNYATVYDWYFGDGNSSSLENPIHTYTEDGYYTVTLHAYNSECDEEQYYEDYVEIITPTTAGIEMDHSEGCKPDTIHFSDASSTNTTGRMWIFDGGVPNTSTSKHPNVIYDTTGVFDVTLIAYNDIYSDTLVYHDTITIHTIPDADFLYSINGNMVTFTNTTDDGDTYNWDFGDGASSTDTNTVHTYTSGGDYDVRLIAINECGEDTITKTIQLTLEANANFTVDTTKGCVPFVANFHNLSNTQDIFWEFEGGTPDTSSLEHPVITYNSLGIFDVTLYATNALGKDTLIEQDYIEVFAQPTGTFTYVKSGYIVNFDQTTSNIDTFSWEFGDGNVSTQEDPSHTYAEDGTYEVKFIYSNSCGTFEEIKEIVIANPPTASFSYNMTTGCKPLTVQFTNTSSSNSESFLWTFEGGNPASSIEENPIVIYENKGVFDASLKVSNSVGSNTKVEEDLINVVGPPIPNFTKTSEGLNYTFTYTGETATFVKWEFGDGASGIGNTTSHTYLAEGDYSLIVISENDCGKDTLTTTITVALHPTAAFSTSTPEGCAALEVQFTNESSSSANSFLWTFEGGNPAVSTEENPIVNYVLGGVYDVSLIAYGDNGNDTLIEESLIVVDAGPDVDFSYIVDEATVTFTSNCSADASTFYWDFHDGTVVNEKNPTHTFSTTGVHKVTLIASNECGEQTVSKDIEITTIAVQELNISEVKLYPNPSDGDFTVDMKVLSAGNYNVRVFDTSGKLVHDRVVELTSGNNKIRFDVNDLSSGIYIMSISDANRAYKLLFNIQ